MPEAYVWPEGQVAIWTGNATPSTSAVLAYAQNMQVMPVRGWYERETIDGVYFRHLTGQSIDFTCSMLYTFDNTIQKIEASATAVHMKIQHNSVNGSAGLFLYSGHIVSLALAGDEANPYAYTLTYRGNIWSAYP